MDQLSLNGDWRLYQSDQPESVPAIVPGCVHTALLAAGKIPDPFYRNNELDVMWIGETDWTYRRAFDVPAEFLAHERVLLRCEGLDTLATITLNGQEVARTDNMFRTWEFDVKPALQAGENHIEVRFAAPLPYGRQRLAERHVPSWGVGDEKLAGGNWLRKEQCNFGWDWGPRLVTSGIWRDVDLLAFNTARLADVHILQNHSQAGQVGLTCRVSAERTVASPLKVVVSVSFEGDVAARAELPLPGKMAETSLAVHNPHLWWPNGLGEQPLYDVRVELLDEAGGLLDAWTKRIGLRTLRLERDLDEGGQSFCFVANGVPFFAKGANWIPADSFLDRISRDQYAQLLRDGAAAHMNMLRVWGGGIYESDVFYDLCDELGLCIWQDFAFACATYPTFDQPFMATVEREVEDNVRRLRHHACMALWCGNNELEQGLVGEAASNFVLRSLGFPRKPGQGWTKHTMSWEDYSRLFDQLLPQIVARLDPETDYWPSSPHSPLGNRYDWNNPAWGDAHVWDIWHGKKPFEFYRTCYHRFVSEFGFQSFPEPRTVDQFTQPDDRNVTSFVMEHHQRSGIGNQTIIHYMLDWFRLPDSFEMTLWLSQILQGMAIKYAVEHWRRSQPRVMGALYWQLNDCWPVASWSSIDYYGRWKALHYMARHFYAPLLLSGVEDLKAGRAELYVTSDLWEAFDAELVWQLTTAGGEHVDSGSASVHVPERASTRVETLNLRSHLDRWGAHNLLLWLDLRAQRVQGASVSSNLVLFARPKHLDLADPDIRTEVEDSGDGRYLVTLTAGRPALWTWLALEGGQARFSDNFFHLPPGQPVTVTMTLSGEPPADLRQALQVHSLVDTYR